MAYKKNRIQTTSISKSERYEGETLEEKITRVINNNEPITDGAPLIYQERDEGINPAYDIRTDRFEHALEASDVVAKSHLAKREERQKAKQEGKVVQLNKGNENQGNAGNPQS